MRSLGLPVRLPPAVPSTAAAPTRAVRPAAGPLSALDQWARFPAQSPNPNPQLGVLFHCTIFVFCFTRRGLLEPVDRERRLVVPLIIRRFVVHATEAVYRRGAMVSPLDSQSTGRPLHLPGAAVRWGEVWVLSPLSKAVSPACRSRATARPLPRVGGHAPERCVKCRAACPLYLHTNTMNSSTRPPRNDW